MATVLLLRKSLILGLTMALAAAMGCHAGSGAGEAHAGTVAEAQAAKPVAEGAANSEATTAQASARRSFTDAVSRGTILRVDGAAEATPGEKLGGYLVRPGTEQPLGAEALKELIALMRADSGFNDSIRKRCRPGVSVGIRLFRPGPNAAEARTDLVLDFGCNRLLVSAEGSAQAADTYFDDARARFVEFAQRALPADAELRALR